MSSSLLKPSAESDPRQEELVLLIFEASISISLITVLSSISALFVATVQLFFAFKIAKVGGRASATNLMRYLPEGKMIRMIVFFVWFLSVIAFLFSCVLSVLLIPHPLGSVAKGIAAALGLTTLVFCAFVALHSLFTLWKLEANHVESTTDGSIYNTKLRNLESQPMGYAPRYSTLV
ncbi:hypothetical protein AAVH_04078 [Aphelenchoides avenae]|nr:hypothetical protein AAVH_04078 [Aphelenchus avenae]